MNIIQHSDSTQQELNWEINYLENKIISVSNEYSELKKNIHNFNIRYQQELGEILTRLIFLRRLKLERKVKQEKAKKGKASQETKSAYEEAQKDYQKYHKAYEQAKEEYIAPLDKAAQSELKKLYRKAALLCHPDKVQDSQQTIAHEIFSNLEAAYKRNDIKKVRKIYKELLSGKIILSKSQSINELEQLKSTVTLLREKLNQWILKMQELKESDIYKTIISIEDWNTYFETTKEALSLELKRLEEENHF